MKREYISSCWVHLDLSEFDGDIDTVATRLMELKRRIENEHPSAINVRILTEHYYDNVEISVYYDRLESDKELETRKSKLAKERAKKAELKSAKEERELKEFERLKKKYG